MLYLDPSFFCRGFPPWYLGCSRLETIQFILFVLLSFSFYSSVFLSPVGYCDIVQLLIDQKANVHAMDQRGWTPLHMAVAGCDELAEDYIEGASMFVHTN